MLHMRVAGHLLRLLGNASGQGNSLGDRICFQHLISLRGFAAFPQELPEDLPDTAPRTYAPLKVPPKRWTPKRNVRKNPPELSEGQVLFTLNHKDLRSFVNQAVDALKRATQWQAGELTSGAMMHCLQSAAASRGKAFQLVQGQMFLVPKQNKLVTFAMEGFMGKVAAQIRDREWTVLRNQEIAYNDRNCLVHHLAGYRVEERGLTPDNIIAKLPGPSKSPTSYRAFLKNDYIRTRPDWILNIVMEADELLPNKARGKWKKKRPRPNRKSQLNVGAMKMQTLEEQGIPWYWLHNAWEARLEVYQHTTPHAAGGKFELVQQFELEGNNFDPKSRAKPFEHVDVDLRSALGWRENRIMYA